MGKQTGEQETLIDKKEDQYGRTDGDLPYDTAGIFSSLFYVWLFRFVVKAFKQEITEDDLYKTGHDMTVKANSEAFEKSWNSLSEKTKGKKNKLFWHLLWHFRRPMVKGYILFVVWYLAQPSLIVLMRVLMGRLEQGGHLSVVLPIIIAITFCCFSIVFVNSQACLIIRTVETRVKTILSSMIYKKVLSMSSHDRRKTTSGHIISLLSSDLERINSAALYSIVLLGPVVLLFIGIDGGMDVGVSLIPSFALGLGSIALQSYYMINVTKICVRRNQETDRRVGLMNEIIRSIRLIKMYCWEKPFSKKAQQLRRKEMSSQLQYTLLSAVSVGFFTPMTRLSILFVVITQLLRGQPILHQTTVGMIGLMRIACEMMFLEIPIFLMKLHQLLPSMERIKVFLMTPDSQTKCISTGEPRVELSNLTGSWDDQDQRDRSDFMLNKITLSVTKRQRYGIVGKVGAGKSTVLRACLDELYIHSGSCSVSGSVAYVRQEPWIISVSVRDNILMGEPYDRVRYYSVIKGCCLEEDFRQLPHGDQTMIGERGLTLSGGQKARIGLARAVYQNADIYLLDDPLSAVDGKVTRALFHNCICGLLHDKVRLLVTHQLQFLPLMDEILLLHKGEEICHGPYPDIEDTVQAYLKEDTAQGTEGDNPVWTGIIEEEEQVEPQTSYIKLDNAPGPEKSKDKNETGTISGSVYLKYVQAGKGIYLIPLLFVVSTVGMFAGVLFDWNIASWDSRHVDSALPDLLNNTKAMVNLDKFWSILNTGSQGDSWHLKYFGVTLCINAFGNMAAMVVVQCMLVIASYSLYNAMFYRVLKAPVWFFDINPVGQVLNRFARDTSFMDIEMVYPAIGILSSMFVTIPDVVFVCFIDYTSLIPLTCAGVTFYIILKLVMPSVTSTKRLEASLRSATFSHISTTLDGLSVIRAMKKEDKFITEAHNYMDKQTSAWFLFIATQRLMAFYIASVCAITLPCIVLILTFSFTDGGVASSHGLAMVYLAAALNTLQNSLRYGSDLETNMTGVERVQQYSKLEQEAPDHEELRPPAEWPVHGRIEFNDMVLTYKDQPKPALGPLTLTIQAGEKVGVIGRTGAGKSSLLVGLMRIVEPSGSIHIDGINTQTIGLADLRSAMAVIPQDPVTFSGTFRYNLDPFTKYCDAELWSVLEKVEMMEKVRELPRGLYTEMTEGGNNVSIGEKQLLCLARAMLKKSKVILVDEATANVDNRTDSIVQHMMHTHLADATVITIAHRLNTLTAADKILVLEHGKLVQYGAAQDLLIDTSGAFYQLLAVHGDSCIQAFKQQALTKHR